MKYFIGSIAHRVFAILLAGMLVAAGITGWLADKERRNVLHALHNARIAERVEQIVLTLDNASPAVREVILQTSQHFGLEARLVTDMPAVKRDNPALTAMLVNRLGAERQIAVTSQRDCYQRMNKSTTPGNATGREQGESSECKLIWVRLKNGALLQLRLHSLRGLANLHGQVAGIPFMTPYFALFLLLIGLLAYRVANMTTHPIRHLADAATELGRDIDRPPLQETGPAEIRQAAAAFNAMQATIKRQIQHRTHMLAAITHDLQTPLTRLRLRMEKVSDTALRDKLIEDLAAMQVLVREGLDLARSMDSAEKMQLLDIDSLLDSICADAVDAGQQVSLNGQINASIMAQPHALRRCLINVVDNAVKYGHHAHINISREPGDPAPLAVIRIRDGGPGIPEHQLNGVFEPFFRGEASRSRDTGGTGLGLAIARNIAENHHATLSLVNHPAGGLEVTLCLPLAG